MTVNDIKGLSSAEVKNSEKTHGTNALCDKAERTFLSVYFESYNNPIITILLIALGINVIFTFFGKVDIYECAGILLSVIISTFVSSLSEYSNESTFRKLRAESSEYLCKVFRNGALCEIPVSKIVVGDFVLLQSGDVIPADGRIFRGNISVNQSALNGESTESEKSASKNLPPVSAFVDFWNRHNLFRESSVCSGEAVMIVDTVGDNTVYGKLTLDAQEAPLESPLTEKLTALAKSISKFGCISAIAIVIITFLNNAFISNHFDSLLISLYFSDTALVLSDIVSSLIIGIIVIVVAVPEGLPLMIAIVCSLNMKKMLKSNVLVRKIIGIETAGGINILFTDKTGTITRGKPRVVGFFDGDLKEYKAYSDINSELSDYIATSLTVNSSARFSEKSIIGGNATEKALLEFIGKKSAKLHNPEVLSAIPFSSENKFSMACVKYPNKVTFIKGAPEIILKKCTSYINEHGEIKKLRLKNLSAKLDKTSSSAMRLIATAMADGEHKSNEIPDNLTLIGIAAIRDDIRKEARSAIKDVTDAGIQVVMITGDRAETATSIGNEIGLLSNGDIILTSDELSKISDEKLKEMLPKIRIIARALPSDKSRLVKIAQSLNLVVGMTGDGVNDAPALKAADVGFSMGGGSEAAAAASDIVILDDNFKSVRNAVLYGRTIYRSIKKFIRFQITINIAAVTVSMLGPIVGIEKPLSISQMIWTNLMIDSLAAIAFGGEPALSRYMKEKPIKRNDNIMDKNAWLSVTVIGLYISAVSLCFFTVPFFKNAFRPDANNIYLYTGFFTFFIFISIFNAFNARCDGINIFENISLNKQFIWVMGGIFTVQILMTYFGGSFLRTAGLNASEWVVVTLSAISVIFADMIRKLIFSKIFKNRL